MTERLHPHLFDCDPSNCAVKDQLQTDPSMEDLGCTRGRLLSEVRDGQDIKLYLPLGVTRTLTNVQVDGQAPYSFWAKVYADSPGHERSDVLTYPADTIVEIIDGKAPEPTIQELKAANRLLLDQVMVLSSKLKSTQHLVELMKQADRQRVTEVIIDSWEPTDEEYIESLAELEPPDEPEAPSGYVAPHPAESVETYLRSL